MGRFAYIYVMMSFGAFKSNDTSYQTVAFAAVFYWALHMYDISVKVKADAAIAHLTGLARKQLPYAFSLAVNKTAQEVKKAEIEEMKKCFDRPTPYTLSGLFMKPGTKAKPSAYVWIKNDTFKGIPAEKFLLPQIEGGGRQHKRFEKALISVGVMPRGFYAMPGKYAQLDQYGNMKSSQIVQILSYFRAFPEAGYRANMNEQRRQRLHRGTKKKRGFSYVSIAKRQGRRRPGVYQIMADGKHWRPVLVFARSASYSKRFNYYDVADRTINEVFLPKLDTAIDKAIASARK